MEDIGARILMAERFLDRLEDSGMDRSELGPETVLGRIIDNMAADLCDIEIGLHHFSEVWEEGRPSHDT